MKSKLLITFFLLILSFNIFAKASSGSSGVGNGGDRIRDAFILLGKNIIQNYGSGFLLISPELKKYDIENYKDLEKLLTIEVIQTSSDVLIDNKGSIVSAIGELNSITLYVGAEQAHLNWDNILLNTPKSERLVLHELLRAAGINDDNFVFTNIILKDQGKITGDKFNFVWSKQNDALITSALTASIGSKTQAAELESFRKFSSALIERNHSRNSELVKIYLLFLSDVDASKMNVETNLSEILMAYRETFKSLRLVNATADQFALQAMGNNKKETEVLAKYFVLNLRQIQARLMQLKIIDQDVMLNYINSLSLITKNNDYTSDSFSMLTSALFELESLIKNNSKKEKIIESNNQIIRMMQSLSK